MCENIRTSRVFICTKQTIQQIDTLPYVKSFQELHLYRKFRLNKGMSVIVNFFEKIIQHFFLCRRLCFEPCLLKTK